MSHFHIAKTPGLVPEPRRVGEEVGLVHGLLDGRKKVDSFVGGRGKLNVLGGPWSPNSPCHFGV